MPVSSIVNAEDNLIIHYFSEYVSYPILMETIQKTLENPDYHVGMNAIWLCEEGTKVDMASEEAQKISQHAREAFDKFGVTYKLALVAKDDLPYGMNKVYEGWSNDRPVEIMSFRELEQALEWIGINHGAEKYIRT